MRLWEIGVPTLSRLGTMDRVLRGIESDAARNLAQPSPTCGVLIARIHPVLNLEGEAPPIEIGRMYGVREEGV